MFSRYLARVSSNRAIIELSVFNTVSILCTGERLCLQYIRPCLQRETLGRYSIRHTSSSSKRWQSRQGRDRFAINARVQGLKSRAAFKLLEVPNTASICMVSLLKYGVRSTRNTRFSTRARLSWIWYEIWICIYYYYTAKSARDMLQDHGLRYLHETD